MSLRYGSVCSGIEAATVAWHPLGWRAQFVCENDAFPCALLAHYYPSVPNLGDMTRFSGGWAYRVLDAQYFDLAQRRPRTFVIASARGWASAAAVLFERESLQGNPAPSRETRKDVAPTIAARTSGDASEDGTGRGTPILAAPLSAGNNANSNAAGRRREDDFNLVAHAFDARQSDVCQYGDMAAPLDTDGHTMAVAFAENNRSEVNERDVAYPLKTGGGKPGQSYPAIRDGIAVRRLTPRECERLQGFPDDYTLVPFRGKPASDSPRYKALGNSMAVPVMRWLGERIELVESVAQELAA